MCFAAVGHADNALEWDADDCCERSRFSKCSVAGRLNISSVQRIL